MTVFPNACKNHQTRKCGNATEPAAEGGNRGTDYTIKSRGRRRSIVAKLRIIIKSVFAASKPIVKFLFQHTTATVGFIQLYNHGIITSPHSTILYTKYVQIFWTTMSIKSFSDNSHISPVDVQKMSTSDIGPILWMSARHPSNIPTAETEIQWMSFFKFLSALASARGCSTNFRNRHIPDKITICWDLCLIRYFPQFISLLYMATTRFYHWTFVHTNTWDPNNITWMYFHPFSILIRVGWPRYIT